MSAPPRLTKEQMAVLVWISSEDWAYSGPCAGTVLDSLHDRRLVEFRSNEPGGNTGVRLTEVGWNAIKESDDADVILERMADLRERRKP